MSDPSLPPTEKRDDRRPERSVSVLARLPSQQSADGARAELRRARIEISLGHAERARELIEELLQRLPGGSSDPGAADAAEHQLVLGATLTELARAQQQTGDDRAQETLRAALHAFDAAGAAPEGVDALDHAFALAAAGRVDDAFAQASPLDVADPEAAGLFVDIGRALLDRGHAEQATDLLGRGVDLDPRPPWQALLAEALARAGSAAESARMHFEAGTGLATAGRFAEAARAFGRALALNPEDPMAAAAHADALRQDGRPLECLAALEPALERAPDDARLLGTRACALLDLGRPQEALAVLDAIRPDPGVRTALDSLRVAALSSMGRGEEALAVAQRTVEEAPEHALSHILVAEAQAALGRLDPALDAIGEALAIEPDSVRALHERADVLSRMGQFEEALATIDRLREIMPEDPATLAERGECLRLLRRYDEALVDLERALELAPGSAWTRGTIGQVLLAQGRVDEGLTALQCAADAQPSSAWIWESLVVGLQGKGDEARALATTEQALGHTQTPFLLDNRAHLLLQLGRAEEAAAAYRAALEVTESAPLHAGVGESLRRLGRYAEARTELERALALDADYAYALGTLGQVLAALGDADAGAAALRRSLELSPGTDWTLGALTEILLGAGRRLELLGVLAGPGTDGMDADAVVALLDRVLVDADDGTEQGQLLDELRQRADWGPGQFALALRLTDAGDWSGALEAIDRALAGRESWLAALRLRCWVLEALEDDDELALATAPLLKLMPSDAEVAGLEARRLHRTGHTQEAERMLRELAEREDTAVGGLAQLAELLRTEGRHAEALATLDQAAAIEPPSAYWQATRGQLLIATRRVDDGIAELRAAYERSPGLNWALYELVDALNGARREVEALELAERAARLPGASPLALALLARTRFEVGEFGAAARAATDAIARGAKRAWLFALRGCVADLEDDLAGACRDLERAVELPDGTLGHRKDLAEVLVRAGRQDEARELFEQVLAETRSDPLAETFDSPALGGWCLYRLGRLDDAIAALEEALAIDSLAASTQLDLALVMLVNGRARAARSEYARGIDVAVENEGARARAILRFARRDLQSAASSAPRPPDAATAAEIERDLVAADERLVERIADERAKLADRASRPHAEPQREHDHPGA